MDNKILKNITGFLTKMKTLSDEKLFLEKIEEGMKNQEFKMYLQFIVDNKTKKIASFEALSRWETGDGQIVLPVKYISLMEKYGIISKLDYYMFELACKKLENWNNSFFSEFTISCNFSRITISEQDFVSKIKDIADKYSFDRSKLLIEITEDATEKSLNLAMENICDVKELGFKIALDDVGTGYTSLISLCEYPVDIIKIDRELLLKADRERGKKLLWGIINLARYLGHKVVCEGVETEEQNSLITESECDYIQGWYYSKAMPETKAEELAINYMERV